MNHQLAIRDSLALPPSSCAASSEHGRICRVKPANVVAPAGTAESGSSLEWKDPVRCAFMRSGAGFSPQVIAWSGRHAGGQRTVPSLFLAFRSWGAAIASMGTLLLRSASEAR